MMKESLGSSSALKPIIKFKINGEVDSKPMVGAEARNEVSPRLLQADG